METSDREPTLDPPKPGFPRPKRSWRLVRVALALIVLGAAIGGGFVFMKFAAIKSSEPYQAALEEVRRDSRVIERLGEPIEDATLFPAGNVHLENDRGDANLHFNVKGPNAQAAVSSQARRIDGKWGLTTLDVTFEDGERIVLDTSSDDGLQDAPKWSPPDGEAPSPESAPIPVPDTNTEIKVELPDVPAVPQD